MSTTYNIDPVHSNVDFSIRHLGISNVRGTFRGVSGTITAGDGGIPTAIKVEIKTDTLDTRSEQRDAHAKGPDLLDAASFPTIVFASTSIASKSANAFTINGNLTLRGVTKPVSFDATFNGKVDDPWGNDRVGYEAHTTFKRSEFGAGTASAMLSDDLTIELQIQAAAKKAV